MAQQTLPVNPMFQNQQIDSTINSDTTLVDPITKCKDLLPQLKQSLLVIILFIHFFVINSLSLLDSNATTSNCYVA
jgi:hypothetical protein